MQSDNRIEAPQEPLGAQSSRHGWRLRDFSGSGYDKQRGIASQALWFATLNLVFRAWWFPARLRPPLLRAFGAKVGKDVLIRHRVRVLWPWKLRVGNDTWIGEDAWLLNLEPIEIGDDVCISQGAYLCTGSHDRFSPSFEFDNASIAIGDQTWIATQAVVLRGVTVSSRSVVGACALVTRDVPEDSIVPAGSVW